MNLNNQLLSFLEANSCRAESAEFCGQAHAESAVWRVFNSEGEIVYLKSHRQPRKFKAELRAYKEWASKLSGVPRLLAVREQEPFALLLSECRGGIVENLTLSATEEALIYEKAGAFLRQMHDLPYVDIDSLPLGDALKKRFKTTAKNAARFVTDEELAWVEQAINELAEDESLVRVPCHRDFSPRNWLVDLNNNNAFSVIDFEHAIPETALADLIKLYTQYWPDRDDLCVSFWQGYEADKRESLTSQIAKFNGLYSLGTIVWALMHGDRLFEQYGREALQIFMQDMKG